MVRLRSYLFIFQPCSTYNIEVMPLTTIGGLLWRYIVGNKAKGRMSKPVFQENKARQVFRKTNISYPLICICTCFEIRPFALLPIIL